MRRAAAVHVAAGGAAGVAHCCVVVVVVVRMKRHADEAGRQRRGATVGEHCREGCQGQRFIEACRIGSEGAGGGPGSRRGRGEPMRGPAAMQARQI